MTGSPSEVEAIEGADPLDVRLHQVLPSPRRRWRVPARFALGLSPMPMPPSVFLLAGIALGPHGLGILTDPVLAMLSPAVSVALAAVGVLIGLEIAIRRPEARRLTVAAVLQPLITALAIIVALLALQSAVAVPAAGPLLAILLGISGSTSSRSEGPIAQRAEPTVGALGDLLPIVAGAIALAWVPPQSPAGAAWMLVLVLGLSLATALAGWLLVSDSAADGEQRVFAFGTMLLLGGAAALLSSSALFAGLVAGVAWNAAGGSGRNHLDHDVRYLQHPLVVMLLVAAGAHLDLPFVLLIPVAVFVIARLAGKLVGAWLAGRLVEPHLPPLIGLHLLSPGLVGIALALDVLQARPAAGIADMFFTIAIAGAIASDIVAALVRREVPA